jgi:phosphatidylinositol kinase/protein kinase (PI-3  family)
MNGIFKEDPACQSRGLNLKTFNVVPITNRLGSLEWVDNTEPLKMMINREHIRTDRHGKELHNSLAIIKTKEFLKNLPDNKNVDDIR